MSAELDELLQRLERQSDISSLCGVSVLLRPSDVFCLLEWIKVIQAERNVLREAVEKIERCNYSSGGFLYSMSLSELRDLARETLERLYAHTARADVIYPTRQE